MTNDNIWKGAGGLFGTMLSAMGISSTQDIESITSIVCTIIGLLITITSCVIIPVAKKIIEAKKDGKITPDEATNILDTLDKGLKDLDPKKKEEEKKEDNKK